MADLKDVIAKKIADKTAREVTEQDKAAKDAELVKHFMREVALAAFSELDAAFAANGRLCKVHVGDKRASLIVTRGDETEADVWFECKSGTVIGPSHRFRDPSDGKSYIGSGAFNGSHQRADELTKQDVINWVLSVYSPK